MLKLWIVTVLPCEVSVALKLGDLISVVLRPGLQIRRQIQAALYGQNLLGVDSLCAYTEMPVSPLNNHILSGNSTEALKHFLSDAGECAALAFGTIAVFFLC